MAVMKRVLMFALSIGLTVLRLDAAKHPTLDPKVDAAKCLECHGDKTKGKSVHSAMASGCLSCHNPHSSALPKLMPAGLKSGLDLCAECHKQGVGP